MTTMITKEELNMRLSVYTVDELIDLLPLSYSESMYGEIFSFTLHKGFKDGMFFVKYVKKSKNIDRHIHTAIDPLHAVKGMINTLYDMRDRMIFGGWEFIPLDEMREYDLPDDV